MAEPGSLCCSRDRQSPPMAQCHFTLHRTEQLFVPSTVCEGYSSFPPCAQGEGRRVVPVGRVWCFSSVKQITLVVAARGCYRSHSAVELGRINEHHPQSPALTAGKSFLGSQPTLGLCCWKILAPGMPECLTWISLIPAQRILQVETHVLLKPSLGCCQGPQPWQRCCAEPSWGSCCSLLQPHPYGAEFHSCSGSTTLAAAAAQEVQESRWLEEGSQQWEALSFLALVFVGGLSPALCGQRTPCSQHRAAGQTPRPGQEQLEPPEHSLAPPRSQQFTVVNQEEQEAELC